jgi:hypothetical protein
VYAIAYRTAFAAPGQLQHRVGNGSSIPSQ